MFWNKTTTLNYINILYILADTTMSTKFPNIYGSQKSSEVFGNVLKFSNEFLVINV